MGKFKSAVSIEKIDFARKKGIVLLLNRAIIFCFFLPPVILIRLLRPLICVRFSELHADRLGHCASNVEKYLCIRDAAKKEGKKETLDIFYIGGIVSNQQLVRMWSRHLWIWAAAKWMYKVNQLIPGKEAHEITELPGEDGLAKIYSQAKPHLAFTQAEEEFGRRQLGLIGVPEGKPFVCFSARDQAYLKTQFPKMDFNYHNYRDTNIMNYIPAVKELVNRGYTALRMGAKVSSSLTGQSQGIIDYASFHRSDFMDIYLGAHCSFFITDTSGIGAIPMVFRRPVVFVNMVPLSHIIKRMFNNYLIIPKKLWIRDEKRFMTFPESLALGLDRTMQDDDYHRRGIEVIENSSQEIHDVVLEMEGRLKGVWQTNEEYEYLQKCFWSLYKLDQKEQAFSTRIGSKFLMQNRMLLGDVEHNFLYSGQLAGDGRKKGDV